MATFSYPSPIGAISFTLDETGLRSLHFRDSVGCDCQHSCGSAQAVADWLDDYFAGEKPDPGRLPLSLAGTPFQLGVWQRLLAIPYGETVSYGALACELGSGARAIGGAVGRNPVALIVPCHRVIAASGALGGYAEGLDRKRWLLRHENCPGF